MFNRQHTNDFSDTGTKAGGASTTVSGPSTSGEDYLDFSSASIDWRAERAAIEVCRRVPQFIPLPERSTEQLLDLQSKFIGMFEVSPARMHWEDGLKEIFEFRINNAAEGHGFEDARFESYDPELLYMCLRDTIDSLQYDCLRWEAVEYVRRASGVTLEELQDTEVLLNKVVSERSRLTGNYKGHAEGIEIPWPKNQMEQVQFAEMMLVAELLTGESLELQPTRGKFGGLNFLKDRDVHLDGSHNRNETGKLLTDDQVKNRHGESGLYTHLHAYAEVEGVLQPWKIYHDNKGLLIVQENDDLHGQKYVVQKLIDAENTLIVLQPLIRDGANSE
jgi:hypothetical protein